MVEITIVCLIYKSTELAEAVYRSLHLYTPKLNDGSAELLFVANDPTSELVNFLESKKYPHIINVNKHLSEEELYQLGYGTPEYIRRVYQGYNQGILHAKGQKVVLINSDNFFSEDWLENLLKYSEYKNVVCSTLVEPGHDKFGVFPSAVWQNFGRTTVDFKDKEFQAFASKIAVTGYTSGGAYMPCLLYKDIAILAGLYPEGNIAGKAVNKIIRYGDEYFYDQLKKYGLKHITAKDSIVYHLKEGEKSDNTKELSIIDDAKYIYTSMDQKYRVTPTDLTNYIKPDIKHNEIMSKLGRKYTIIISNFSNNEELQLQVNEALNHSNKNLQIIVIYSDVNIIGDKNHNIEYVYTPDYKSKYEYLFELFNKMYGEFLIVISKQKEYPIDFDSICDNDILYYTGLGTINNIEITDDIDNFVLNKSFILDNLHHIIDIIITNNKLKLNTKKHKIRNITPIEIVTIEKKNDLPKLKRTIPYKILRMIYREGLRSTTSIILNRIKNNKNAS